MRVYAVVLIAFLVGTLGAPLNYTGENLSCAEFGSAIPGTYNKDYTFPTNAEADYLKSKGGNIVRLPVLWERLQPNVDGSLDPTYSGYADNFIKYATGIGLNVIVDPHNYARYYGQIVGQSNNTAEVLGNLWSLLAKKYASNNKVFFGLMNEPHDMQTENWLTDANTAIAAIRAAGANNLILVPGNGWTGASSWNSNYYGTPNGQVMLGVKDPANNFIFEVHQYLDSDGSGTHADCVSTTIGVERVTDFTNWARTNKYKAFLGEFAGGNNDVCQQAVSGLLNYMESNADVWTGFSWWAAGPWWGNYMYSIEPTANGDAPQMAWLTPHFHGVF
jgi:endoglucanase